MVNILVQKKCKSNRSKIWKPGVEKSIFEVQLHEVLEIRQKCTKE